MGPSDVPVPSSANAFEGPAEGQAGRDNGSFDPSTMAIGNVVDISHRLAGGATFEAATLPFDIDEHNGRVDPVLPGPSGSSSNFGDHYRNSLVGENLDQEDLNFLSNHVSSGTSRGYAYAFQHFNNFCTERNANPYTCPPSLIVKFLRMKFESGASYSSINLNQCAVSKFHQGYFGKPIGEHPLVSQAVRAVFRLRPPLPKYKSTFDISPVLDYVASLEPLDSLSLKLLTLKTFFLVANCSLSRVSSVARLRVEVEKCKLITPPSVNGLPCFP